jgi:beta-galactosidase
MKMEKWKKDWKFWADKRSFALVWSVPDHGVDIDLPHDGMICEKPRAESANRGSTGYRDGGNYVYRKIFSPGKEDRNKTFILKFEGIYMNAFVYINEQLAGKCPNGYSTFYVELNDYLNYGEDNEVRIFVRNGAMPNSRWYSGSGIYRDVYLLESGPVHIVPEGVQISTEMIYDDYAVLSLSSEIKNRSREKCQIIVETILLNRDGNTVAKNEASLTLFGNEERKLSARIAIDNPLLWSENTPYLYTCLTRILKKGEIIDQGSQQFGIRTLHLDSKRGLRINGKTVKLRGACIHHDSGIIGAATYEDAQYRQIKRLKMAGFNAVRMAHHPMAQAMLRACDKLGMYVMDESFDMWTRFKSDFDYAMNFDEWWERDLESMVKKDFNHPSVIMYSLGNEIPEIGTDRGSQICHKMSEKIKYLDPTRYTLSGINGVFATGDQVDKIVSDISSELKEEGIIEGDINNFMALMKDHMDRIVLHPAISRMLEKACPPTDIAGYNYMTSRYEKDGIDYPNRIIVGSETYPPAIAENWRVIEDCDHVIGDFTWTGWDYIGEAGVGIPAYKPGEGGFGAQFPCQLAYVGDFDLIGIRRPASYYREIVFGLREQPYIVVQNPRFFGQTLLRTPWVLSDASASWNWPGYEGQKVIVEVYSPGDEVELFKNGKSLGKLPAGKARGYRAFFETTYDRGSLEAVTYEEGIEISRILLETAQADRKIHTQVEYGEEGELIFVEIAILDQKGNLAIDEEGLLKISVKGDGELIGFGTGNPKPGYNYNETETNMYQGRALAILKRDTKPINSHMYLSYDGRMECDILL